MRRISNSEAQSWNQCKTQYRYAHDMAIAPKRYGQALSKGILFHEAIAKYYETIRDMPIGSAGYSLIEAKRVIQRELAKEDEFSFEICVETMKLLENYNARYSNDPQWEILEVESSYDLEISPDYTMPMRLDLLVRDKATDEVLLVDTKTCYNFFSDTKIALYGQIPKYVGALRANGHMVNGMLLNQVRTRPIKDPTPDQLWKRQKVSPSTAKIRRVLHEHILISEEITKYRELPDAVRPVVTTRALNDVICNMCSFKDLCMSELDGGNIDNIINTEYRTNPYNYNVTDMMELL